jgi:hypothetical protein
VSLSGRLTDGDARAVTMRSWEASQSGRLSPAKHIWEDQIVEMQHK